MEVPCLHEQGRHLFFSHQPPGREASTMSVGRPRFAVGDGSVSVSAAELGSWRLTRGCTGQSSAFKSGDDPGKSADTAVPAD